MTDASNYYENKLLDCLRNVSDAVQAAYPYVQLHTDDPGEDCTANVAAHTTRVQCTFGSAASGGTISNTVAVTFSSLTATETISHISLWDASTSGNPLYYGDLTATKDVNAGDTLEFAIGDIDISIA